jgi:hypothetical protein
MAEETEHETTESKAVAQQQACSPLVGRHGRFSTWDGEICACIVLAEKVVLPWDSDMLHVRYMKANGVEQYGHIPRDRFKPNNDSNQTPPPRA